MPKARTSFRGDFWDSTTSASSIAARPCRRAAISSSPMGQAGWRCIASTCSPWRSSWHEDPAYEDVASKFWEHFTQIAYAMNNRGEDGVSLWNDEDGFFYDVLHVPNMGEIPMKTRSMVGLIPLYAVDTLEPELLRRLPAFKRRMDWFIANRPGYTERQACMFTPGMGERRLIYILDGDKLRRVLRYML